MARDIPGATIGDIDNHNEDNYVYDGNGNMQCDLQNGIGFIVYDIFNQPVLVCKTAGSQYEYSYYIYISPFPPLSGIYM